MLLKPSPKYLEALLFIMEEDEAPLGQILMEFKSDLPKELVSNEQIAGFVKYCVKEDLATCYLGAYPYYEDVVLLEKPLCFQYIEDPKYWQWPIAFDEQCVVLEITLKGLFRAF